MLIACLSILSGCSSKIDIGGEISGSKIPADCQVRVRLENNTFSLEDKIKLNVGFGFIDSTTQSYATLDNAIVELDIDANGFNISDEKSTTVENLYEKEFNQYTDDKFVCSKRFNRYVSNYYEPFELMLNSNSESTSGTIQISVICYYVNADYSGQIEYIYYATNGSRISFSVVSIADAQKKL